MKFKESLKNRKTQVAIGALVLCIAGGGVFAATRNTAKASGGDAEGATVTKITKQNLTKSISVTGTISSAASYSVSSEIVNAAVKELNVKVGDNVHAGDVLAKLDDKELSQNVKNAQASAGITNQQGALSVTEAERNYNTTVSSNDIAVNRATEALNAARADTEAKKQKLAEAKQAYDALLASPDATEESKEAAKSGVDAAQESLNAANQTAISAQQALDDANTNRTKSNADSLDAVTNSKLSAQNSEQSANQAVTQAKDQLAKATVKAPADGVVTAVNVKVGDTYTGGVMIVIQDVSGYKVSATLDQYDISDVVSGMNAVIKTDTTGDEEMTGSVTFVSPTPADTSSNNVTSATTTTSTGYPIEISIDHPSDRLRIGMNAKVTIELTSVKNVLTVPANAVQQDENGDMYVEVATDADGDQVADNDEKKKVKITQGLNNGYYVEITGSGLSDSMSVILPEEEAEESSESIDTMLF